VLFAERNNCAASSLRVGEVETDARVLCYRSIVGEPFALLAVVDGSFTRPSNGHRRPASGQEPLSCAALRVS
jgi:hypothetical protein